MFKILNLSKTYPEDIKALNSIKIGKGIFGLIRPNGSGKSSLMRTIAILQEPDKGSMLFENIDILKTKRRNEKSFGISF